MNLRKVINRITKYITNKNYRIIVNSRLGFYNNMDDKKYLELIYPAITGKRLNIENPETFNEKIQWLKLNDRKKYYNLLVDKYEAKKVASNIIGSEHIVKTLGVYENFSEIDFSKLPNQFVIKTTHDSSGIVICKDKTKLCIKKAEKKIRKALKSNYYYFGREWAYKDVKPRIIVEEYLEDNNSSENGILDYKFYCFNGEPKFLYVGFANFQNGTKHDMLTFFDLNWNSVNFYRSDHQAVPFKLKKPEKFDEMIECAKKLSKNIPFVRIDLFYIDDTIYFSEFTLYPGGGFGLFEPFDMERKIGNYIDLKNL